MKLKNTMDKFIEENKDFIEIIYSGYQLCLKKNK